MREAPLSAQLSPLDTQRFGVRTARARVTTVEEVPEVLDFCAREGVQFLIARCRADDLRIAHQLEQAGGATHGCTRLLSARLAESSRP